MISELKKYCPLRGGQECNNLCAWYRTWHTVPYSKGDKPTKGCILVAIAQFLSDGSTAICVSDFGRR